MKDDLKKLTEDLNKKFAKVYFPDEIYQTVADQKVLEFSGSYDYKKDEILPNFHFGESTDKYDNFESALKELKEIISKRIESVISDNYEKFSIFWRLPPIIEETTDFETLEKQYIGFTRFTLIDESKRA